VLTADEGGPNANACDRSREHYSVPGAVLPVTGACAASLNSSLLLATRPLCMAKPRAVDQDSAGTAPCCHWLVGDSGKARECYRYRAVCSRGDVDGQCSCWSLVSVGCCTVVTRMWREGERRRKAGQRAVLLCTPRSRRGD
jgi:hypothetical protein